MTTTAAEARADMLINGGVVAKASWQHVFAAPADKQPPLRISAVLDNSYRNQLGLDINDMVQGDVGVDVTVSRDPRGERRVHLRADLFNADVVLESVAWRKPKGRASVFEFDVVKGGPTYPTELHNVRLVGDNVAIEGWMGIGADNKLKEFRFPNFSLNVVTSLETYGKVRTDGVWDVTAKGPTYDGRDLFRSFFDVAPSGRPEREGAPGPGSARRGGHGRRLFRHHAAQREDAAAEALQQADLARRARRAGGRQAVRRRGSPGGGPIAPAAGRGHGRRASCSSSWASIPTRSAAPSISRSISTARAPRSAPARCGCAISSCWATRSSARCCRTPTAPRPGSAARVVREQFEFEIMRVPFSVGHGQFVMHNAVINGQLVSASMQGKVDFRAQALERRRHLRAGLGPHAGAGRSSRCSDRCSPVRAAKACSASRSPSRARWRKPQVIVNPLSLLTPGIIREIWIDGGPARGASRPAEPERATGHARRARRRPACRGTARPRLRSRRRSAAAGRRRPAGPDRRRRSRRRRLEQSPSCSSAMLSCRRRRRDWLCDLARDRAS